MPVYGAQSAYRPYLPNLDQQYGRSAWVPQESEYIRQNPQALNAWFNSRLQTSGPQSVPGAYKGFANIWLGNVLNDYQGVQLMQPELNYEDYLKSRMPEMNNAYEMSAAYRQGGFRNPRTIRR